MKYHAFQSHAQADASGTVAAVYFLYKGLGLHNWIDMRQAKLTLEGMKEGVQDADVFLLFLSEHIFGSWFCQQEILTAIEEKAKRGMKIQLLIEEDSRFAPFDVNVWEAEEKSDTKGLQHALDETERGIQEQRQAFITAASLNNENGEAQAYKEL